MFTGIVQGVGRIAACVPRGDGVRIEVEVEVEFGVEFGVGALRLDDVVQGESVAVAGCCLTVVERRERRLAFDVSAETLACTTGFAEGCNVNLERALRLSDRLGGHLLAGHVDGVGKVLRSDPLAAGEGSRLLEVEAPAALARFIAAKGSIAIDGVSLTVNAVAAARFSVNLIPHTLAVTTLPALVPGAEVNLEVDLVARYLARLQGEGGK